MPIQPDELWYRVIQGHPVTNAWFWRREVFEWIGLMHTDYRFAADREFLIRAILGGVRPIALPLTLYLYRQHPDSATISAEGSHLPGRGAQRLQVITEGMRLLEGFLDKDDIPEEGRLYLKSAHSASCYRCAAIALYHRRWGLAAYAFRQGMRYDRFWPLEFARRAWHRVLQQFGLREPI